MKYKFHGNGMLVINVDKLHRVHLYHDVLPKQQADTSIHNHRFSFTSEVKVGGLINIAYGGVDDARVYYGGAPPSPYKEYSEYAVVNEKLVATGNKKWMFELSHKSVRAGEQYDCSYGLIHRVQHTSNPTITWLTKTSLSYVIRPLTYSLSDIQPDNNFDNVERFATLLELHNMMTIYGVTSDEARASLEWVSKFKD